MQSINYFQNTLINQNMKQIAKALLNAQMEMGNAIKDSKNPYFKSSYADLNSIREACMPSLNRNGIVVLQPIVHIDGKNFVKTMLLHESGETIESFTEIVYSKQNDAQAQGSGITYARRYGLQSLVNVGAADDDGNAASQREEMINSSQINTIETLLQNSSIDENEKSKIDRTMNSYTFDKANKCIEYLQNSQVDSIEAGAGYSLTDINKKVKAIYNSSK
jgi:hypothetical protein